MGIVRRRVFQRLKRATRRWIRGRIAREGLILVYHRVTELPSDPFLLSVTPRHFAEHLDVLRTSFRPTRLQELVQGLCDRGIPRRSVVVTFDDGYMDNLHEARPLLERYDVPITLFVAAGYVGQEREFWWDSLEKVLLFPGTLPETLGLDINGAADAWKSAVATPYGIDDFQRWRRWNVLDKNDPTPRHRLFRELYRLLRPLPEEKRRRVLSGLAGCGESLPACRQTHRPLSLNELVQMADGGLVEIGAHTVTHPTLTAVAPADQRAEIQGSKAYLEGVLQRPVTSFAYPYGQASDFSSETVAIVEETGFACACSALSGTVRPGVDHFRLPRILVGDLDGDQFTHAMRVWLDIR